MNTQRSVNNLCDILESNKEGRAMPFHESATEDFKSLVVEELARRGYIVSWDEGAQELRWFKS